MKLPSLFVGLAVLAVVTAWADPRPLPRIVVENGVGFRLAVPTRTIAGPLGIGPLYNSIPRDPRLYFVPTLEWIHGKTNVPNFRPVLRHAPKRPTR